MRRYLAIPVLLWAVAHAQTQWHGRVSSAGKPIPGATVTVVQSGQSWTTVTSEDGKFRFDQLPAGPVQVELQMFGFQPLHREVPEAERTKEAELVLSLRPYRSGTPAVVAQSNGAQLTGTQAAQSDISTNLVAPPIDTGEPTESFLVQGSLSRGLSVPANPMEFGPLAGPGGPGGPGFEGGGPGGAGAPGMPSEGGTAGAAGMTEGGGMRGGRGGFGGGGGPGGPGGGGPGGMGPGMRGGSGVPEGGPPGGMAEAMQARLANMSPEERQRVQRLMQERMRQRGFSEGFGNRSRRTRDQIRGGAFYSVRNSALDATPYSLNGRSVTKPEYSQQRFGVNLGGPLSLGKIFAPDNTFFFINYSGLRGDNPYSSFAIMPTALERGGDFSSLLAKGVVVRDPFTGNPFPNNAIPSSRISPTSQGLLDLIPLPNNPGATQNYQLVSAIPQSTDTLSMRLNRTLTKSDRLAFSVNLQRRSSENLQLYGWSDPSEGSGQSYDLSWTHNFSPRVITTARMRYNLNRNQLVPYFANGEDISGNLGIEGNSRDPLNYGPPNLSYTNYGSLNDGNHSLRRIHNWSWSNNWTLVYGRHSVTTGFEFTRLQWNTIAEQNARGTLFFGGLASGYDFADFLLGFPQQSSIRYGGADTYMRQSQYAGFVQDQFRVNSRLTLNLGLRYEDWEPFTEKYSRLANLDFNSTTALIVTPGSQDLDGNTVSRGLIGADRNNFSPRVGFSWRAHDKTNLVVRGGYSLFYDGSIYTRVPSRLGSQPPFAVGAQYNSGVDALLTITDPFTGPQDDIIKNTYAMNHEYRVPYAQTWSLSVSRSLKGGHVVDVGYLATKGTALVIQRAPNRFAPGTEIGLQDRPIANALSFTYDSPEGNSIFHAAQFRLTRRMRRGLSYSVFYTYSKSIDNASSIGGSGNIVVQDDNNLAAERGLSGFDRRHQLQLNLFLASPFGPRGRFMKQNTLWSKVLRDWNLTTSLAANSGTPLTATVLGAKADTSGTGTVGSNRADATGLSIDGHPYFNTAAFAAPPATRYGNAARNTIPGPGIVLVNASFGRQFQVGDSARRGIEFRATADNLLNHVNLTGYGTVVNAADYGLATSAGNMRTMQLSLRLRF